MRNWSERDEQEVRDWRPKTTIRAMQEKIARARNPLKKARYVKRLQAAQARLLALKLANS